MPDPHLDSRELHQKFMKQLGALQYVIPKDGVDDIYKTVEALIAAQIRQAREQAAEDVQQQLWKLHKTYSAGKPYIKLDDAKRAVRKALLKSPTGKEADV